MAVATAKLSTISTLDSTQFGAGIAKMQTSISGFSAMSLGAFARIGSMAVEMGRKMIHALPSMVSHSLESAHALEELSTQLGFSTGNLANLQRVAGLAGMDMGTLETVIGKMNATLGEAMGGSEEAQKRFTDLGLSWQKLAQQSPEDTLNNILDALGKVGNKAKETALERGIFGRGGIVMGRLAKGGSAGIAGQMGRTQGLGIATQPADIEAMSRARSVIEDLKNNFKGLGDQITIRLAPVIEFLGKSFLNLSASSNLAAKLASWASNKAMGAVVGTAQMGDFFGNLWSFVKDPKLAFAQWYAGVKEKHPMADALMDEITDAMGEADRLSVEQNNLLKQLKTPMVETAKNTRPIASTFSDLGFVDFGPGTVAGGGGPGVALEGNTGLGRLLGLDKGILDMFGAGGSKRDVFGPRDSDADMIQPGNGPLKGNGPLLPGDRDAIFNRVMGTGNQDDWSNKIADDLLEELRQTNLLLGVIKNNTGSGRGGSRP